MLKKDEKTVESETKKPVKKKYEGIVAVDGFVIRGVSYPKGTKYNCKDAFSLKHLRSINKIL